MNEQDNIQKREITTPFDFLDKRDSENNMNLDEDTQDPQDYEKENEEEEYENPPQEEESEEEEKQPEEEVEYDVKIKGNLAKYAAEALKAKGGLPDDFEITDDITEEALDAAYVSYKEEPLKNQLREEIKKEFEQEGLTPDMIEEIKFKYYGVQDPEIVKLQTLKILSTYEFDEKDTNFENDVRSFLTGYYQLKGFNETRTNSFVEADLNNEELIGIIKEAQTDLGSEYSNLDLNLRTKVKERQEAVTKSKNETLLKTKTLLDSGEIAGVKYSKEEMEVVRRALFDKTEIVTDADGKQYRATLYYKKQLEARNNLEKDLHHRIAFILGGDLTSLKNKEREKTTNKIMSRLNNHINIDVKPKSNNSKPQANTRGGYIERKEIN